MPKGTPSSTRPQQRADNRTAPKDEVAALWARVDQLERDAVEAVGRNRLLEGENKHLRMALRGCRAIIVDTLRESGE